jgi:hypothetical protein
MPLPLEKLAVTRELIMVISPTVESPPPRTRPPPIPEPDDELTAVTFEPTIAILSTAE